jgi:5-methyltetrahydropteroyltriglutamate--homocysteine methyltransferase
MKRSNDRILTTHTGSLPRPAELLSLMSAAESGATSDIARMQARARSAVAEVVRKQIDAGVDIVNDGEASKPSYATYVKDRLTGFHGEADVMSIGKKESCSSDLAATGGIHMMSPLKHLSSVF